MTEKFISSANDSRSDPASRGSEKAKECANTSETRKSESGISSLGSSPGGDIPTDSSVTANTRPVKTPSTLGVLKTRRMAEPSLSHFWKMLNASSTETVIYALNALAFSQRFADAFRRFTSSDPSYAESCSQTEFSFPARHEANAASHRQIPRSGAVRLL